MSAIYMKTIQDWVIVFWLENDKLLGSILQYSYHTAHAHPRGAYL